MPYPDSNAPPRADYANALTIGEKARIDFPLFVAEATNLPRDYVADQLARAAERIAGEN